MSELHRRRIHQAAHLPGLTIQDFTNDMMDYMDAADLIVSMGGYNTICEILTLRKRAIIVPRVRPVQEQWIRAHRMARLGLLRTIHPDELTPTELMRAIIEELHTEKASPQSVYEIDLDGMSRIADCVSALLHDSTALPAQAAAV